MLHLRYTGHIYIYINNLCNIKLLLIRNPLLLLLLQIVQSSVATSSSYSQLGLNASVSVEIKDTPCNQFTQVAFASSKTIYNEGQATVTLIPTITPTEKLLGTFTMSIVHGLIYCMIENAMDWRNQYYNYNRYIIPITYQYEKTKEVNSNSEGGGGNYNDDEKLLFLQMWTEMVLVGSNNNSKNTTYLILIKSLEFQLVR